MMSTTLITTVVIDMARPLRSIHSRIKENARLTMESLRATREADKAAGAAADARAAELDAQDAIRMAPFHERMRELARQDEMRTH